MTYLMVLILHPHSRQINLDLDTNPFENASLTDAAALEYRRRAECAGANDNLLPRPDSHNIRDFHIASRRRRITELDPLRFSIFQ